MLAGDTFVCVYGDSVYEFNLRKMLKMHKESNAFVSMALMHYSTKLKYGFIDVEGNEITGWREKPEISGLINIGCYVMEPEFLKSIPRAGSFGMDDAVRSVLSQKKKVKSFEVDGSGFIDIGDKKSYLDAYKQFASRLGKI